MATQQILIIEDEKDIAELIQLHLKDIHIVATLCHDGQSGLDLALSKNWDLVILDLRLPRMDGLEICRRIRESSAYIPVLMLSAKSTELDRVLGLEIGADDYLTKPFSILELMARVKAHLRRSNQQPSIKSRQQERIQIGKLDIQIDKRSLCVEDTPVELTAKEFDLLVYFASNPGRVYKRVQLLDQIWGYGHDGYEHTVNSHINRLRSKIEPDPADPTYIVTVWGVGYKMSEKLPEPIALLI